MPEFLDALLLGDVDQGVDGAGDPARLVAQGRGKGQEGDAGTVRALGDGLFPLIARPSLRAIAIGHSPCSIGVPSGQ